MKIPQVVNISIKAAKRFFEPVVYIWKDSPIIVKAILAAVGTFVGAILAIIALVYFVMALDEYPGIIIPVVIIALLSAFFYGKFKKNS